MTPLQKRIAALNAESKQRLGDTMTTQARGVCDAERHVGWLDPIGPLFTCLCGHFVAFKLERPDLRAQVDALQPPGVPDYDARETRAYAEGYRRAVYDVLNRLPDPKGAA